MRDVVKTALTRLFGHVDTDTSLYVIPVSTETRVAVLVLDTVAQARQLASKFLAADDEKGNPLLTSVQWSETVVAVRFTEMELVQDIVDGGVKANSTNPKKGIKLLAQREFDPRGNYVERWSDKEVNDYLTDVLKVPNAKKMNKDVKLTMISDDHFGNTGEGVATVDPADEAGARMVKIYKKLAKTKAVRGSTVDHRDLIAELKDHADDSFESGRKRRISELKKLVKMSILSEKDSEGMLGALTELGKQ